MIFCSAHASKRMPLDAAAQPISLIASEEAPAGTGRSWFNSRVCDYCFQEATMRKPSLRRKSTRTTSALAPEVIGVDEDEADAPTLRDHSSAFRKLRSRASHDSTQAVVGSFQRLCEVPFPPAREVVPWRCDEACGLCGEPFGVLVRRHHCRMCGESACSACAPRRLSCPSAFASSRRLRVCHSCARVLAVWQVGGKLTSARYVMLSRSPTMTKDTVHFDAMLKTKQALLAALDTFEEGVATLGLAGATLGLQATIAAGAQVEQLVPVAMAQLSAYALAAHAVALGGRRRSERHNVQRAWKGHLAACVPRYHSLKRALDRKLEQRGGAEALYLEGWCSVTRTPGVVPSGLRKLAQGAAVPRRWCVLSADGSLSLFKDAAAAVCDGVVSVRMARISSKHKEGNRAGAAAPGGDDGRGGASMIGRARSPPPPAAAAAAADAADADTDAAGRALTITVTPKGGARAYALTPDSEAEGAAWLHGLLAAAGCPRWKLVKAGGGELAHMPRAAIRLREATPPTLADDDPFHDLHPVVQSVSSSLSHGARTSDPFRSQSSDVDVLLLEEEEAEAEEAAAAPGEKGGGGGARASLDEGRNEERIAAAAAAALVHRWRGCSGPLAEWAATTISSRAAAAGAPARAPRGGGGGGGGCGGTPLGSGALAAPCVADGRRREQRRRARRSASPTAGVAAERRSQGLSSRLAVQGGHIQPRQAAAALVGALARWRAQVLPVGGGLAQRDAPAARRAGRHRAAGAHRGAPARERQDGVLEALHRRQPGREDGRREVVCLLLRGGRRADRSRVA